jgi:hypothetical protein
MGPHPTPHATHLSYSDRYWLLSSERDASLHYLEDPHTTFVGVGIVLVGASMAFGFNLAVYYFVLYTYPRPQP